MQVSASEAARQLGVSRMCLFRHRRAGLINTFEPISLCDQVIDVGRSPKIRNGEKAWKRRLEKTERSPKVSGERSIIISRTRNTEVIE